MWLRDQAAILEKKQEDSIEVGKEIGRKEGEAIGLEKGEAIGWEKGRDEGVRNVALRMLKKGTFSIEAISETTGLTEDAVRALANEMSDIFE